MVVLSYTVLALRQRSIYIPSTGYISDYHVIQQAQQATVTGMGLGDGARGAYEATNYRSPSACLNRGTMSFSSQVSTIFVDGCNCCTLIR